MPEWKIILISLSYWGSRFKRLEKPVCNFQNSPRRNTITVNSIKIGELHNVLTFLKITPKERRDSSARSQKQPKNQLTSLIQRTKLLIDSAQPKPNRCPAVQSFKIVPKARMVQTSQSSRRKPQKHGHCTSMSLNLSERSEQNAVNLLAGTLHLTSAQKNDSHSQCSSRVLTLKLFRGQKPREGYKRSNGQSKGRPVSQGGQGSQGLQPW